MNWWVTNRTSYPAISFYHVHSPSELAQVSIWSDVIKAHRVYPFYVRRVSRNLHQLQPTAHSCYWPMNKLFTLSPEKRLDLFQPPNAALRTFIPFSSHILKNQPKV